MQQELRRIKNKDLSKMDQRLFAGLDKIQTIDSTLQNLGQFQQFLLQQITQFEQKAKQKNTDKQVTEVIEQNCSTLRESIMRVVPEIQQTHSRLRMSHLSPVNGFRSTGFEKWRAMERNRDKQMEQRVELENKGSITSIEEGSKVQSSNKRQDSAQLREKVKQLTNQLNFIKSSQGQLSNHLCRAKETLRNQLETKVSVQLKSIMGENLQLKKQNQSLKQENNKITLQNTKLNQQVKKLNDQLKKLNEQVKDSNKGQNSKSLNQNNQSLISKQSLHQNRQQQVIKKAQQKKEYKSFMDKIKSDFSTKIRNTYIIPQQKNQTKNDRQQKQQSSQSTFRQSTSIKQNNLQLNVNIQRSSQFRSVQMTRDKDSYDIMSSDKINTLVETDMNVPKLLRRNSVVGNMCQNNNNHQSNNNNGLNNCTFSQSTYLKTKTKLPINQLNQQLLLSEYSHNVKSKSIYERHQPSSNYQSLLQKHSSNHNSSTSKKTNHDLMRKTKSNFFTNNNNNIKNQSNNNNSMSKNLNDKQNYFMSSTQTKIDFDKTTQLFKSKELTNDKNQLKRRSQSKQKLKIVSLL